MSQSLTQPCKYTNKETKLLQLHVFDLTLVAGGAFGVLPAVWLQEKKKQYSQVMAEQQRVGMLFTLVVAAQTRRPPDNICTATKYSLIIAANEIVSADTVTMMMIGVK